MDQFTNMVLQRRAWVLATVLAPWTVHAADAVRLSLDGVTYVHRWSKDGQNEFTPPAEADLKRWQDMVTVNVFDKVRNGEQLAEVANTILGNYQKSGKILRTDSVPQTPTRPAEHFIGAVLATKDLLEAVFARALLVEGTGVVIVRSHRIYGQKIGPEMSEWLLQHGARCQQALMGWTGMPSVAALRKLPQNR